MTINKIEIKVFTEGYIDKLYRDVKVTGDINNYYQNKFPYEERFPKGKTNIEIDSDFELDSEKSTIENSIAIYEQLKLNETQASDPRLWTYLSHVTFWAYMRNRWALEKVRKGDDPINRVIDRYLLITPNLESLTRNGISRLWWYAHLTVDDSRSDRYELTKILLRREDVSVGIAERLIVANRTTRFGVLEFLKENEDILSNENMTRQLLRNFILFGGTKILPVLGIKEIKNILETIKPAV